MMTIRMMRSLRNICPFVLLLVSGLLQAQSDSEILMTIADQDVTVGEFRYIYEKNNGEGANYSQKSIEEYIDLYAKFKLKVAEARAMGLDTISELNEELDGYRKQLADSYIMDKEVLKKLTQELYERKKTDIRLSHILISVSRRANDGEVASKRKTAEDILIRLRNGESFEELARKYSQDKNNNKGGGDFGWLTAKLPSGFYDFESAMYELEKEKLSDLIRTPLGFHIIKVTDRRPARGQIKVAHILKRTDASQPTKAKVEIDKLYAQIASGADFDQLAAQHSDDEKTANRGGALPPFGIQTYEKSFENAAFSLEVDGDYSRPIKTKIGWHIIKRIEKPDMEPYAQYAAKTQASLKKDERYKKQKERIIEEIKQRANYKFKESVLNQFADGQDATLFTYKWRPQPLDQDQELFSFGKERSYQLSDFISYLKDNTKLRLRFNKQDPVKESVYKLYDGFVKEMTLKYEQANLADRYPEYKSLMREYEEGILLFEASKREVWDKASKDTLGLYTFYESNKSNYMWLPRADVASYTAKVSDAKKAEDIYKCAKKKNHEKLLKKFNKKEEVITAEIKKVEHAGKGLDQMEWKEGARTELNFDEKKGIATFKKILEIHKPSIKTLEEARGYVIADYQDQLEQAWVKELKNKYPVEINEKVLKVLIK